MKKILSFKAIIVFILILGCAPENKNQDKDQLSDIDMNVSQVEEAPSSKNEKQGIFFSTTSVSETEERRIAAKVLAPLLTSSHTTWNSSNSRQLDVRFELLTYSPIEDMSFIIHFYNKEINSVGNYVVNSSEVSQSGFGTFVLYSGGPQQNKIQVAFSKTFSSEEAEQLKPTMYCRVFIKNANIQDPLGTINGLNWGSSHNTLYTPKILSNQLDESNSAYDGNNQDDSQRYIKISTASANNSVVSVAAQIDANKSQEFALTASEELLERRSAAQVLAPLLTSSNTRWRSGTSSTMDLEFEVLTYSPVEDLSFSVCFYTENNESMSLVGCTSDIDSSYISLSGFGTVFLRPGGVQQNKIRISLGLIFSSTLANLLKPSTYYRVFVGNDFMQDQFGTVNDHEWSGKKYTLYVPKILDGQFHPTNTGYEGSNQDNAQRYIKVAPINIVLVHGMSSNQDTWDTMAPQINAFVDNKSEYVEIAIEHLIDGSEECWDGKGLRDDKVLCTTLAGIGDELPFSKKIIGNNISSNKSGELFGLDKRQHTEPTYSSNFPDEIFGLDKDQFIVKPNIKWKFNTDSLISAVTSFSTKQQNFSNYRVFAIDFSNSNQLTYDAQGYELKEAIDDIKQVTGVSDFVLIGHSMGGLALRAYIQNEVTQNIKKLITIDTPHYGGQSWLGIAAGTYTFVGKNAQVNLAAGSRALQELNSEVIGKYESISVYHLGYSDDLNYERDYYVTGDSVVKIGSQMGPDALNPYRVIFSPEVSPEVEYSKAYETSTGSLNNADDLIEVEGFINFLGNSHTKIHEDEDVIKYVLSLMHH